MLPGPRETGPLCLPYKLDTIGFVGRFGTDAFEYAQSKACCIVQLSEDFFWSRPIGVEETQFGRVLFDQVIKTTAKATFTHALGPRISPQRDARA